ncbi:MAG: amino acid permease [Thermoleophilia bacterium]|nr:amino acid permease [Thermoleophilia bacterium]
MTTTSTAIPERPTGRSLKRSLGLWMATALVIGNMVGSGVFLLPASLASIGPISIVAWVFTGAGAILLALVFGTLGRAYPRTGGPYAYSRRAFGDFIGFQTAWGYWIAAWAGNAAITVAFVGYLSVFWNDLASNRALAAGVGLATIWLLTAVNAFGVREGGRLQLVTTVLKFVPLAVIGLVGLFFMKSGNFTPFSPGNSSVSDHFHAITTAAALTVWAFIGLESATIPAEEVKDPKRTLPLATIIGTVATTALYILATVAIMGMIPAAQLANSASPFADAARIAFGGSWDKVIAGVAMISTFGALNGWILLQGRVPLAAAEDGLFPKRFAKVNGSSGTPVFGLVVSSMLLSVLMVMNYNSSLVDQFTQVILLATLTTLVPYAYSSAAQLQMLFTDRKLFDARRLTRDAVIAGLAFAFSFWMIYGAGTEVIAKGFLLMLAGVPVYVYMKWRQNTAPLVVDSAPAFGAARAPLAPAAGTPVEVTNGATPLPREQV